MADAFYTDFFDKIGGADIDLLADTIKVILIDAADYTFSAAHDFLDDVAAAARVSTGTLASKTLTDGVFDAADTVLSAVSGDVSEALILYDDTPATEATKPLICYIDSYTGLPVTPNGSDITIAWPSGGILSLA